jgi:hypothetical protein
MKEVFLFSFYRRGNESTERFIHLPMFSQLAKVLEDSGFEPLQLSFSLFF